jgi:hypothetical protein
MFSFLVMTFCKSLLSFHLQSACTFSKSILRCIHKVVKVTVSYNVCVPLCPSVCTEQLDCHWADFCEIWCRDKLNVLLTMHRSISVE